MIYLGLQTDEHDIRSITDLLVSQIEFANIIIINKIDLIDSKTLYRIKQVIRSINCEAKILESNHSNIGTNYK